MEAIVTLAGIYSIQGQGEKASSLYSMALFIKKIYPEHWYAEGKALSGLNRHEEALKSFNQALNKQPDNIQVLREKEKTLMILGLEQEAEKVHTEIDKLNRLFSSI